MAERLTLEDAITHAKEVAERNRKQYKNCPSDRTDIKHQTCEECAEEHEQLAIWLAELKRYKDLEEQGRLIELPCAVGDTVYEIANITWEGYDWKYPSYENAFVRKTRFMIDRLSSIGRFLFLTKEEAEAKLKELRGEQE